jgi:hypothetical protein
MISFLQVLKCGMLFLPMGTTCPTHLIFLHLVTLITGLFAYFIKGVYHIILKELKTETVMGKILKCKNNLIQHINRMQRDRIPKLLKY